MASKRSRHDFEADLQKSESPFVVYGTRLPLLDEHARDDGSYVPVWKQDVTDDQGRKRLHGAFTGGFSAGYFNTVGSKEGWTPATFVSSRKNRAKDATQIAQQRPEDFMDEEDLREQEETKHLSTTQDFAGFGTENDFMRKDMFMDLFRPTEDTIGIKLLKRMGWRPSRDIGTPFVPDSASTTSEREGQQRSIFEDSHTISYERKTDFKGLGFGVGGRNKYDDGESDQRNLTVAAGNDANDSRPGLSFAELHKKKRPVRKGSGISVLDDTVSDDEDPYTMGPKISYNRIVGGEKAPRNKKKTEDFENKTVARPRNAVLSKMLSSTSSMLRKCRDGRLPLSGFVLAEGLDQLNGLSLSDDTSKPAEVPDDWKSRHLTSSTGTTSRAYISTSDAAKASGHTAKSRAQALGETALPGKSVFDYLSPAARERLVTATGRQDLPPAKGREPTSTPLPGSSDTVAGSASSGIVARNLSDLVPHLDQATAQAALRRRETGFMPYSQDLPKRERYRSFLEYHARPDVPSQPNSRLQLQLKLPDRVSGVSNEDWAIEMQEFARAAEVFKPVSGHMASRFTSASSDAPVSTTNTHAQSPSRQNEQNSTLNTLLTRPSMKKPADPAEEAAKVGMFGPMTRTVSQFTPSRLLCKRFGVSMPDHTGFPQPTPATATGPASSVLRRDPVTQSLTPSSSSATPSLPTMTTYPAKQDDNPVGGDDTRPPSWSSSAPKPAQTVNSALVDPDKNDALEAERPGAAVFRAIFGDDDDDDDDDSD